MVIEDVANAMGAGVEQWIELEKVSRVYGSEVTFTALHPCSLSIAQGEFVVFLGPSGSGKTTLLNLIGALDQPSSGTVHVAGEQLTSMREAELCMFRRRHIGFVFQFFNLVASLTVAENVALAAELRGRDAVDGVAAILEALGIGDLHARFPSEISGGQQQRVAIARALAKRPSIVLADEPTGALDEASGKEVLRELERASRQHGVTVLIVTHHEAVGALADRVIRLRDGRIVSNTSNASPVSVDDLSW